MDIILQSLLQNEREVARLSTVAVIIRALVIGLCHRHVEHTFSAINLLRDLWQIGNFKRSSVLFNNLHQRNSVKIEFVIFHSKLILRKVERLLNQVDVLVLHLCFVLKISIQPSYIEKFLPK